MLTHHPTRHTLDRTTILSALTALRRGDFSVRLPEDAAGLDGKIAATFNEVVALHRQLASDVERLGRDKAKEGVDQGVWLASAAGPESSATKAVSREEPNLEQRSEFLRYIAHELRTPLNTLFMLSDHLSRNQQGNLSARQVEFAKMMKDSGNDLLSLIDDVVDLLRLESGVMAAEPSMVSLAELRENLERDFGRQAESMQLDLEVSIESELPASLVTDVRRLRQVLDHLLANALASTAAAVRSKQRAGRGRVGVRIHLARSGWSSTHELLGKDGPVVAFEIEDAGAGISQQAVQSLSGVLEASDTRWQYGGLGLGLALCRELTWLLGGELRVASEKGAGSSFTLYVPNAIPAGPSRLRPSQPPAPRAHPRRAPIETSPEPRTREPLLHESAHTLAGLDESAGKVNILLVDDKPEKLQALQALLTDLDEHLETATSGEEALSLLARQDFAVILLDVRMPIMDGFQTAAMIRQLARAERTPIIFLTANDASETHVSRGYSLGAVDYISAPIDPEVLRAKVAVFIDLSRKTQQVERQADWLRQEAERRATSVETRLRHLLDRLDIGVFRSTIEGKLLEANPAFLNLLGLQSLSDAASVDLTAIQVPEAERGALGGGSAEARSTSDVRLRRADGAWVWCSLSRTVGEDGQYVDGLLEDISERKMAVEAIAEQARELARSNADLQQFAYVASHDLQEPLRMVASFTDLLARRYKGQLDAKAEEYIKFALDGAERMQRLVRDLLAYSRLDTTLDRVCSCDTNQVLDNALWDLKVVLDESQAEVARGPLPVVRGDSAQLTQLFENLVGNAVKFRGDNRPRVHVSATRDGEAWTFEVADNGIGIDPKFADRIFVIFQRLHRPDRYPGTGIGLAICKRIVEHHGGTIWFEPNPTGGSRFRFTLPIHAPEP